MQKLTKVTSYPICPQSGLFAIKIAVYDCKSPPIKVVITAKWEIANCIA